jgi:hypothetical protein
MKKIICFILVHSFINAHSQDSAFKHQGSIYKSWPGYKLNGRMLKEKEVKAELYKVPASITYYGLSLIPPAILFASLSINTLLGLVFYLISLISLVIK